MNKGKTRLTNEKTEKRNFLGVGFYRCASTICESMIKAFGAVFIYKSSGKLSYVMYYMMIYSFVQILTNVLLNKFFAKYPKISLLLRSIPYLAMFSLFFFEMDSLLFMILFSVLNGLVNSFGACPLGVLIGKLKQSSNPKAQSFIQAFDYLGGIVFLLASAFILDRFDSKWVSLAGIIIYVVLTTVFFFLYKEQKPAEEAKLEVEKTQNETAKPKQKFNPFKNYYPWVCEGLVGVVTILDVFFVLNAYVAFSTFVSAAVIKIIISVTNLIGSLLIAWLLKKIDWKIIGSVSIVLAAGVTIAISFVNVVWLACILAGVFGLATPFHLVPFDTAFYANGNHEKNSARLFAMKDTYRKLTSIPIAAICLAVPTIGIALAICGGLKLLVLTQVVPAGKVLDCAKQNRVNLENNSSNENLIQPQNELNSIESGKKLSGENLSLNIEDKREEENFLRGMEENIIDEKRGEGEQVLKENENKNKPCALEMENKSTTKTEDEE